MEITIVRGDSTLAMSSCSTCDTRWWWEDGRPVELARVFDAVGASK